MPKKEKLINMGTISLYADERQALKKSAFDNSRKISDQLRWYIRQALITDGYLQGGEKCTPAETTK